MLFVLVPAIEGLRFRSVREYLLLRYSCPRGGNATYSGLASGHTAALMQGVAF